ncbi:MAG: AbrB/MazE/SpoVT family DNA-binding domain-containing protein [Faecousia sp.]
MRLYRIIGNEGRITIPYAIRQAIGFLPDDVVSFQLMDADSVLVRRETLREKEKTAPTSKSDTSLIDYLESLSPKEQYTAMVHLSVLWAQGQEGKKTGRDCG